MKVRVALLGFCMSVAVSQAQGQKAVSAKELAPAADMSREIVDVTMARLPTAQDLGPWEYSRALFLMGELSVYQRTHDPKYLEYAEAWANSHENANGDIDRPVDALDFIMPGNVDITLYQLTGKERYRKAVDKIYAVFSTYPRTEDGGLWHASNDGREHQLWADGTFMALPFLVRAGVMEGHGAEAEHEAMQQLLIYYKHLHDPNGPVLFHAYDESGKAAWADPKTHDASVKWARAIGWYCIALTAVLDALPKQGLNEQDGLAKEKLLVIAKNLARDLTSLQDPKTGMWFQVIDKPNLPGNFVETSSSSMFVYFLDAASKHGYIDPSYRDVAQRGYRGVMSKIVRGADGHYHVTGICEGTNVGSEKDYLARHVYTDDFHGLGAFLMMNEEVTFDRPAMEVASLPQK